MDKTQDLLAAAIGLIGNGAAVIMVGIVGYIAYKQLMSYWVEAKANEWMIVIRNGEQVKKGIGLCTWIMPGDQAITFPSQLN